MQMLGLVVLALLALCLLAVVALVLREIRRREMHRWLWSYLRQVVRRRAPREDEEVHVILCIADHFEPKYQGVSAEQAAARVHRWRERYPEQFARFRDSDGRMPRHTFFYPAEEYEPEYLSSLAELCGLGHGEVEIHLHHDNDTADNLRHTLIDFRDKLAQHGLLARTRDGEVAYAFIHGNWALCNSRPDGRYCGVNNEIEILRQTGCYADLTLPSAPSAAQIPKINTLYYAFERPGQPRSHGTGIDVGTATEQQATNGLLMIQGPLGLDWTKRKWGLLPRLENGCLQRSQPPDIDRLATWLGARVQVPGRPDWFFVKLYCHGTIEEDSEALLGEAMVRFHANLAERARRNPKFQYHYVTAREMYNLIKAAEAGWAGSVLGAVDYELLPGPASQGFSSSASSCQPSSTPAEPCVCDR